MNTINASFDAEVTQGERFEFGKNWKNFITHLNADRIAEAEKSLIEYLGDLKDKNFIDIGSGSGLFSLAAKNSGASVLSIDFDPSSVYCTKQLKEKYYSIDANWKVKQASVLDKDYLNTLGQFDIVYSWGVLHHTGKMWEALENVCSLVAKSGLLFIAIYNEQGFLSRYWTSVKIIYNKGSVGRILMSVIHIPYFFTRVLVAGLVKYKNPFKYFSNYKKQRGMSVWHDWIDWLGGYPFETAEPEQIKIFYEQKGFELTKIKTTNSLGCNEFVFKKK